MNLQQELNPDQLQAVLCTDGPSLVIAGAGSGKTRVLTYKIAYLIEQGVPAENILALTFTNKAAREMRERIYQLVGVEQARRLWMGTFHSIAARILRQEANALGFTPDFTIYDTTDSKSLIKQIVKEMELDDKVYKSTAVLSRISMAKNSLLTPTDYSANQELVKQDKYLRMGRMGDIFFTYNQRLKAANAMDFDDLLFNLNLLLIRFDNIRYKWQHIFTHILVDEYQDTNHSQYRIVTCLAEPQNNICVVGDDAQSIYSFRGADISNILHFREQYKGSKFFQLKRNYRSTQNIVNVANSLIKHNVNQIPKDVYSDNEKGEPIEIVTLDTDRAEAAFLAKDIRKSVVNKRYSDFAVLYRTNAQSRTIEDEMRKLSIPYRIYGGVSFYQRKEIKDSIAYFRLAVNDHDDEALLRIINYPARGIGDTTVRRLLDTAHEHQVPALEICKDPNYYTNIFSAATTTKLQKFYNLILSIREQTTLLSAYDFAKFVLTSTQILSSAVLDNSPEGIDKYQNLQELLSSIHEFEEQEMNNDRQATINNFLSEVALLTDQDERQNDNTPSVTLMTVHSAKGLEFMNVYIAGMEDKLFPSMFAVTAREIEEERRLFYVAITRAKSRCVITNAKQRFRNGQIMFSSKSQFIDDLDPTYLHINKTADNNYSSFSQFDFPYSRYSQYSDQRYDTSTSYTSSSVAQNKRPIFSASTKDTTQAYQLTDSAYQQGTRVRHDTFGLGTILEAYRENNNDKIKVRFDTAGIKVLLLKFAKIQIV
ncbi:MAG: UvrD-helicase domain-containing protein [Paludibacteraceae bacterium]|nr:UvrD-helicase domain-containing protein [Paludibacteraceae bacterium]